MKRKSVGLMQRVALPYTRRELPGWGALLRRLHVLGNRFDDDWQGSPTVLLRGKSHGFLMHLDLSDWAQRMTYFLGRHYELPVQRALDVILREGDHFVDIGANIGMISLHARSLIGSAGRIDCFEPIPDCAAALREHFRINGIQNATVHDCALSDQPGRQQISITSAHTGTATLAAVDIAELRRAFWVDVRVGDDCIDDSVDLIKIDVEGFELRVLKGLERVLATAQPFLITELIESQLVHAGTSVDEVADFLMCRGYAAYGLGCQRRLLRHQLRLLPMVRGNRNSGGIQDVLWVPEARRPRIAALL